jgi:hypothetical protein
MEMIKMRLSQKCRNIGKTLIELRFMNRREPALTKEETSFSPNKGRYLY